MSELNDKSVTHDSFGTKPATANPTFQVIWKNADGSNSIHDNTKPFLISIGLGTDEDRDWNSFKKTLHPVARGQGFVLTERITYLDSDGDTIPIDSQCEFDEALKYAKNRAAESLTVSLILEKNNSPEVAGLLSDIQSSKEDDPICPEVRPERQEPKQYTMPPMQLDVGVTQTEHRQWQSTCCGATLPTRLESLSYKAPEWFTNYMQNMKEEIATEVSKRVTKSVLDALHKKGESQYDSATNTRRRHRHADKQRKKHNKNSSWLSACNETWHWSSLNRRRGEKTAKKRDIEEATEVSHHWSSNFVRSEQIPSTSDSRDGRENVESPGDTCWQMMDPVADSMETPVPKLHLLNAYDANERKVEQKLEEDVLRMGCSVTGQDMLERSSDRICDYDALSDSDNISIISDVSHASDMQMINNNFEMIIHRPTVIDNAEVHCYDNIAIDRRINADRPPVATIEFADAGCVIDDLDNARDSSSFELLSEPPSPALSIHMDEDHFSPGKNEANNYNMNDDTTVDKRGNQSKIEICPYAIDAQGKIYQQNIIDGDEPAEAIVLEKRSGGAYSFVGETLPGSTKESVILTENRSEPINDEVPDSTFGNPNRANCDVGIEVTIETNIDSQSAHSSDSFHDSTQSFHSHTASQADNDRRDFEASASTSERGEIPGASRSHIFVDRNASKGLGDTKRSSPRKQATSGNRNSEEARSERQKSNRRSSHDCHASGNRGSNPRQGERSRRFANWSTTRSTRMMDDLVFNAVDPMHILPETLVTGAVHVASSAYTTARRVYDKILTAQTRKPADKSKFGRR